MAAKKMSPLKFLATLHRELKEPTLVTPKSKTVMTVGEKTEKGDKEETDLQPRAKTEILEAELLDAEVVKPKVLKTQRIMPEVVTIQDSSFIFNLNVNLDSQTIKNVVEHSAKIMTGLAASAAVLGTALVFRGKNREIRPSLKVLLPNLHKTKIPRDTKQADSP